MTKNEIFESDDEIKEDLLNASKEIGRAQLKKRFDALENPMSARRPIRIWFAAAAMLVVIIAAVFLMRQPTSDSLFSENYTKFPNKVAAITRGDSEIDALKNIMISYEGGEYAGLISQIQTIETEFPQLTIYKAIVLLEEGKTELAQDVLIPLSEDQTYPFQEEASWYLGLSYLKTEEIEKSKSIMTELIASSDKYGERARNILDKL